MSRVEFNARGNGVVMEKERGQGKRRVGGGHHVLMVGEPGLPGLCAENG